MAGCGFFNNIVIPAQADIQQHFSFLHQHALSLPGSVPGGCRVTRQSRNVLIMSNRRETFFTFAILKKAGIQCPFLRQSAYSCIFSRGCIQDIARHNIQKFILLNI
jgi:hypothetical protein